MDPAVQRMHAMRTLATLIVTLTLPGTLLASDWPQWLGPQRDGVSNETGLVAGERAILFHQVEGKETVDCLDPATGKRRWRFDYACSYEDPYSKGNGPR